MPVKEYLPKIIIAAIVFIVMVVFFFTQFREPFEFLINLIFGKPVSAGTEESELIVNAIACSYHRCILGCSNSNLGIVGGKSCQEDLCTPYKDRDGKVCDTESANNPIIVTLKHDTTITRDHFEWFKMNGEILLKKTLWYPLYDGKKDSIFIKEDLKKKDTNTFLMMGTIQTVTLKPDKYYIWTIGTNTFVWDSGCNLENNCCIKKYNDGQGGELREGLNEMCLEMPSGVNYGTKHYSCPGNLVITEVKVTGKTTSKFNIVNAPAGQQLWYDEVDGDMTIPITYQGDLNYKVLISFHLNADEDDYVKILRITCDSPSQTP